MLIWFFSLLIFVLAQQEIPKGRINHLDCQHKGDCHRKPERECHHKPDCHRRRGCGCCHRKKSEDFEYKEVKIKPSVGIYTFNFGKASFPIKQTFTFFGVKELLLTVWDCFCSGDSFNVFDNQVYLGQTSSGPIGGSPCDSFSSDPKECLTAAINDSEYNWGSWILIPGKHNITFVPYLSPFGKGSAFLRLDQGCPGTVPDTVVPCCFNTFSCSYQILNRC